MSQILQQTSSIIGESMIDAKQAATALRLPYYWFADHSMRAKHSIPHYLMGGLVRYRLSELEGWAANSAINASPSKTNRVGVAE